MRDRAAQRAQKQRYWEDQLEKWKKSGLGSAEYCRENNLKMHQFWYWRRRFLPQTTPVTLVEIPIQSSTSAPIRLVVDGYIIEIDRGFDPQTLESLIGLLQRL